MNPVLITTNNTQIDFEKNMLNNSVELFQTIYNAFKAINVTPTLQDIHNFIIWTVSNTGGKDFVQTYVVNKLLDAAAPYNLNGVQLQRSKVQDMIAIPDLSAINQALSTSVAVYGHGFQQAPKGDSLTLMTLLNDVVGKVANSDSIIEAKWTFYTQTDAGATFANNLQSICDLLNTMNATYNGAFAQNQFSLFGIDGRTGTFKLSLQAIRAFERNQS